MPSRPCRLPLRVAACCQAVRRWLLLLGLATASLGLGASPVAPSVEGTVTRVTDGDSLWLEPVAGGAPLELRLLGIDAPEICQPWGPEAKQALAELVLKKGVSVRISGRDTHGRTLGTVYLDTLNVNKSLVQEGHAWSHRYKFDRGPYVADERMAKALSRGLNRAGDAVMPRDFRRQHGSCQTGELPQPAAASARARTAAPAATAIAPAVAEPAAQAFRCDGRTRCGQMRSCAEANYFLKNCPGVKMDGNGDGVPCEAQWCNPTR